MTGKSLPLKAIPVAETATVVTYAPLVIERISPHTVYGIRAAEHMALSIYSEIVARLCLLFRDPRTQYSVTNMPRNMAVERSQTWVVGHELNNYLAYPSWIQVGPVNDLTLWALRIRGPCDIFILFALPSATI